MLYFLKQLVILIVTIYKVDKLLDEFGIGVGSMLAYINFNLIMEEPLSYVNKRLVIGKILNIPIEMTNKITRKNISDYKKSIIRIITYYW